MDIIEIIHKFEQGKTEPYLCRCSDELLYVVKGRSALARGCINEWLCAALGTVFGLPIPDYKILQLPTELMDCDARLEFDLGYDSLFGSAYQHHLEELNREILAKLDPQLLRDVFIFDYWVRNDDRNFTSKNGGNPNLFYRQSDNQVVVVDHNLAFDPEFDLNTFKQLHLGSSAWFDQQLAETSINYYKEKMDRAIAKFDAYCDNLPPEWLQSSSIPPDWRANTLKQLVEFKKDSFWELLK